MKYILETYLWFLQEKEWTDEDDPGAADPLPLLQKVVKNLHGLGDLGQQRQAHQPNMLNVYIKRALGDYRGRADSLNSYRFKKVGVKDWDDVKRILQKAIDHEKNIHPEKFLKGIKTIQDISKEPLGKETKKGGGTSSDSYVDGVSTGPQAMTGGPMGGGGGGQ